MAGFSVPVSRVFLFLALAAGGCALDLTSKHWIFAELSREGPPLFDGSTIVLVPGVFSLTTSVNEGALFGLGHGMTWAFAGLSMLAAAGIIYWLFLAGGARDVWLTCSLGMVMGGIFGNLYDRLGLPGLTWHVATAAHQAGDRVYAVRDWMHFEIRAIGFDWPVFNIADSLLVIGAAMLFWHALWRERRRQADVAPQTASQGKLLN